MPLRRRHLLLPLLAAAGALLLYRSWQPIAGVRTVAAAFLLLTGVLAVLAASSSQGRRIAFDRFARTVIAVAAAGIGIILWIYAAIIILIPIHHVLWPAPLIAQLLFELLQRTLILAELSPVVFGGLYLVSVIVMAAMTVLLRPLFPVDELAATIIAFLVIGTYSVLVMLLVNPRIYPLVSLIQVLVDASLFATWGWLTYRLMPYVEAYTET